MITICANDTNEDCDGWTSRNGESLAQLFRTRNLGKRSLRRQGQWCWRLYRGAAQLPSPPTLQTFHSSRQAK